MEKAGAPQQADPTRDIADTLAMLQKLESEMNRIEHDLENMNE